MEPLYYYFDSVNRSAISVKPKQPLLNWINALYPDLPEDGSETTVYLVKARPDAEELEKWLSRNFKDIFDSEFNDRHTGEEDWPQKRTYKLFKEWFEVQVHSQVLDVEESPLKKN